MSLSPKDLVPKDLFDRLKADRGILPGLNEDRLRKILDGMAAPKPAAPAAAPPAAAPAPPTPAPPAAAPADAGLLPEDPNNPFAKQHNDWLKAARRVLSAEPHPIVKAQMAGLYQDILALHLQAATLYDGMLKTNPEQAAASQRTLGIQLWQSITNMVGQRQFAQPPGTLISPSRAYDRLLGEVRGSLGDKLISPFYDKEAAEKSGSTAGGLKIGGILGFLTGIFAGGVFFPKNQGEEHGLWSTIKEWGIRLLMGLGFAHGGNMIQDWVSGKSGVESSAPAAPAPTAPYGNPLPAGAPGPAAPPAGGKTR